MKHKKILIGIGITVVVLIIGGLLLSNVYLMKQLGKSDKDDYKTQEKVIKETAKKDEKDSKEQVSKDKEKGYVKKIEIPKRKVTEKGNTYNFSEEYLGWWSNEYTDIYFKQIDGENLLTDIYVNGYQFVVNAEVAVMNENTFDFGYNITQDTALYSGGEKVDATTNVTIEPEGDIFYMDQVSPVEQFLIYYMGESVSHFQEMLRVDSDNRTTFDLAWYFLGKFEKQDELPETYKVPSSYSGNSIMDIDGNLRFTNYQPINNRVTKETYPKLNKYIPKSEFYYYGDLENPEKYSLIRVNTTDEDYSGYSNFTVEFLVAKVNDDGEYNDTLAAHSYIFTAYNIEDSVFYCMESDNYEPLIGRGKMGSAEEIVGESNMIDGNGQRMDIVKKGTLPQCHLSITLNENDEIVLKSDFLKINGYVNTLDSTVYDFQNAEQKEIVYKPIQKEELKQRGLYYGE